MKLLLDTNILIFLSKDPTFHLLEKIVNPDNQRLYISVVSLSELKSLALQYKWGLKKWQIINSTIRNAVIIDVNENLVDTYAEIDAYSQRRNPRITDYSFVTPRNMGKNDLWIAATASLLGLKLVTTDADFAIIFLLALSPPNPYPNFQHLHQTIIPDKISFSETWAVNIFASLCRRSLLFLPVHGSIPNCRFIMRQRPVDVYVNIQLL